MENPNPRGGQGEFPIPLPDSPRPLQRKAGNITESRRQGAQKVGNFISRPQEAQEIEKPCNGDSITSRFPNPSNSPSNQQNQFKTIQKTITGEDSNQVQTGNP